MADKKTILVIVLIVFWLFYPANLLASQNLLISHVDVEREFIEIVNLGPDLSLENHYLVYWSKNRNLNNPWRIKKFPKGSFLANNHLMRIGFLADDSMDFDWLVYRKGLLSNSGGAIAVYKDNPWKIGFRNFLDLRWWGKSLIQSGREAKIGNRKDKNQTNFLKIEHPEEFLKLKEGTKVIYRNYVIAQPGILGKKFFYINGAQVYSFKEDFPDIKLGDLVQVKGELSFPYGEVRIKTKNSQDIQVIGSTLPSSLIQEIELEKIESLVAPKLVRVQGQVVEKTGSNIYLLDKNKEILVYLKEGIGIDKKKIKEKDFLQVTGVLVSRNKKLKILPRNLEDIVLLGIKEKEGEEIPEYETDFISLDFSSEPSNFRFSYLFISFGTLGSILTALLIFQKKVKD